MIETLLFLLAIVITVGVLVGGKAPAEPPGVMISHTKMFGWDYSFQDGKGMQSTGYLTRNSAIRAARAEYERRTHE